ncbi:DNA primase family protein [Pseudoxanthomonas mexicana]
MSTTVTSNPQASSPVVPKKQKINTAAQSQSMSAAGAFKKSKAKFQIKDGHTAQWNFAEYLKGGMAGHWAAASGAAYKWERTHWRLVDDGLEEAQEFIHSYLPDKARNSTANDAWNYAVGILSREQKLPAPNLQNAVVPCLNGYVHIDRQGNIMVKPADRELGFTYVVNATVAGRHGEPHTPTPVPSNSMFGRFLDSALSNLDVRALVQEQCALSLIPGPHQIAFWWFGAGGNGKGVMTSLLKRFHQNYASVWLHQLNDPTKLAKVVNASLILTPEVARGKWHEEEFKALNGGDVMSAKLLYKDPVNFVCRGTHFISSNDKPFITDISDAVYRRLCFVEWTQAAGSYERIDQLDEKIMASESHLVLDWLLEGLQRIAQRGNRFMPEAQWPECVRDLKSLIRSTNDCVGAWADACNVVGVGPEEKLTPKTMVYESYKQWCMDDGRNPLAENIFWRKIWGVPRFRDFEPRTKRGYTMRFNDKQVNAARLRLNTPVVKAVPAVIMSPQNFSVESLDTFGAWEGEA